MSRYFQFEFHLAAEDLLPESWQKLRGGENLESVYWLYNRTGERFLLDLAHPHARTGQGRSRELVLPRRQHRHGLPPSPAAGEGPIEEVELIPMGCARLRISTFPVVKD